MTDPRSARGVRHPVINVLVIAVLALVVGFLIALVRYGPMKAGDAVALSEYDAYFARPDLVWVELTREVVELAAAVRVRHGLRTPDALQAASCLQFGADHLLLTGDGGFRRVEGLNVVLLA